MKKLLIVDGNSILSRAFYGIRPLTAPDGTPTNAVYGFLNILLKYLDEGKPDYLCVAFDLKAPTFRHTMYEGYKAQRKPTPEELLAQLPVIKEVLGAMNCVCLEKEGYEADDIIGTVSRVCEESGVECSILTGDKDDLQLASDLTKVKLVITRMGNTTTTTYGAEEVAEKYGVTPKEYIDVKALMGDPSDNIPGVKGIGEKTAFSLIQSYQSIEKIYDGIDTIEVTPSVRKKLGEGKESAFLSKTLATIDRQVPMEIDLDAYLMKECNGAELSRLFTRLSFKSFLNKFNLSAAPAEEAEAVKRIEATAEELDVTRAAAVLDGAGELYYELDLTGDAPVLYFSVDGKQLYFVKEVPDSLLEQAFAPERLKKAGFNLKDDIVWLKKKGISFSGLGFDVSIASYLINPSQARYELDSLCLDYLGVEMNRGTVEEDGQISMGLQAEPVRQDQRMIDSLAAVIQLKDFMEKELDKCGQTELYQKIELPLVEVLADMQYRGVYVDKEALTEFGAKLKERIESLTASIYEAAGEEFNINSTKQLGHVLFETLKLPHGKKTKTGYSTNIEVLNKLQGEHPIIDYILEYRQLTKLHSTYVEGLLAVIDKETGRIHSNFNQTVTLTGRISSTEPNLQNIPVRTELGREIRRMFTAEGDTTLVDADYSQIELRVLAHISDDETMKSAFLHDVDIHTQTASQVFGVPLDLVSSLMRTRAKAVNFGIVYGIGAFSLAQNLKISRKEADEYIKGYLHNYPKVEVYMNKTIEDARENGYVSTMFNRRRYMPELKSSNKITQAFGERVAMNAPIQGTAADIIKIAMVSVYRRLKEEGLRSGLILQVHDELIVEAEQEELERVRVILKEEMENACELNVPLVVDMKDGHSWYDTK